MFTCGPTLINPAAGDFLLDTFTGTGNMSTHVGETYATWSLGFPPTPPLTDFTLDGSGHVEAAITASDGYMKSTGTPSAQDFKMELSAKLFATGYPGTGPTPYTSIFALDNMTSYLGGEVQLLVSNQGSGNKVYAGLFCSNGADSAPNTYHDTGVAFGADAVLRLEVTNSRKTYTLFVNDVQLDTYTLNATPPAVGVTGFSLSTGGIVADNIVVNSVRGWNT